MFVSAAGLSAFGQSVSFGVKGGIPITDQSPFRDESRPYVVGPSVEVPCRRERSCRRYPSLRSPAVCEAIPGSFRCLPSIISDHARQDGSLFSGRGGRSARWESVTMVARRWLIGTVHCRAIPLPTTTGRHWTRELYLPPVRDCTRGVSPSCRSSATHGGAARTTSRGEMKSRSCLGSASECRLLT